MPDFLLFDILHSIFIIAVFKFLNITQIRALTECGLGIEPRSPHLIFKGGREVLIQLKFSLPFLVTNEAFYFSNTDGVFQMSLAIRLSPPLSFTRFTVRHAHAPAPRSIKLVVERMPQPGSSPATGASRWPAPSSTFLNPPWHPRPRERLPLAQVATLPIRPCVESV
jgi:hypothetical protein